MSKVERHFVYRRNSQLRICISLVKSQMELVTVCFFLSKLTAWNLKSTATLLHRMVGGGVSLYRTVTVREASFIARWQCGGVYVLARDFSVQWPYNQTLFFQIRHDKSHFHRYDCKQWQHGQKFLISLQHPTLRGVFLKLRKEGEDACSAVIGEKKKLKFFFLPCLDWSRHGTSACRTINWCDKLFRTLHLFLFLMRCAVTWFTVTHN